MPLTPDEFHAKYPLIMAWIGQTLTAHAAQARAVAELKFPRLPGYFSAATLANAKVVAVDRVPVPPLTRMGLAQSSEMERFETGGITYLDTFFVTHGEVGNDALHFHELIHVVQWRILGPERFFAAYAAGLEQFGYRHSPLEVMAYDLEDRFKGSPAIFDAEKEVAAHLA